MKVKIENGKKTKISLAEAFPEIAKEWHPTKNGKLTPEMVTRGSMLNIYWQCSHCGYEYQRIVNNQTKKDRNSRCPKCKTPVTAAKSA